MNKISAINFNLTSTMKSFIYIISIGVLGYIFSGALVYKNYQKAIEKLAAQPTLEASIQYSKDISLNVAGVTGLYYKKADLLNNMKQFGSGSHESKTVFRLTIPVIMKLFDLTILRLYYLQLALGLLICILLSYISFSITRNYFSTVLVTVSAACTYFVQASFTDDYIWGDTFAYFFILTAICFRKRAVILMLSVIALFFCDERGILVIPIIWMCIKFFDINPEDVISRKNLLSLKDNSIYLYLTVAIAIFFRLFLSYRYELSLPKSGSNMGLNTALKYLPDLQTALFSGLESFWGIIFLTIIQTFIDKKFILGIAIVVITCALSLTSCIVFDITRSITYLLPICFISIWYFKGQISILNKIFILACSINLFYPSTFVILGWPARVSNSYLFTKFFKGLDFLSLIFR